MPSMAFAGRLTARHPLDPLTRESVTTPQTSLHAADRPVATPSTRCRCSASTPTSRPTPGAALPGTLASPRTGLTPAGCPELIARLRHNTSFPVTTPELLDAQSPQIESDPVAPAQKRRAPAQKRRAPAQKRRAPAQKRGAPAQKRRVERPVGRLFSARGVGNFGPGAIRSDLRPRRSDDAPVRRRPGQTTPRQTGRGRPARETTPRP
jgi:hypothetical protein